MSDEAASTARRARAAAVLGDACGDVTPLRDVGVAIERAVAAASGEDERAYGTLVRTLRANLERNETLARRVREGEVAVDALVMMARRAPRELATVERRCADEAMEARLTRRRTRRLELENGTETEAYRCECGGNSCVFVLLSDVRDIRKAEIWGGGDSECVALVQCRSCGREWRTTAL